MAAAILAVRPAFVTAVAVPQRLDGRSECFCARAPQYRASWLGVRVRDAQQLRNIVQPARHDVVRAVLGGGGILGVGPQEVLVIAAVGWFLLGPRKLMALSKDIGRLVGQIRRAADDARTTFTDALESDIAALDAEKGAVGKVGAATASTAQEPRVEGPLPYPGGDWGNGVDTTIATEEMPVRTPEVDAQKSSEVEGDDAVRSNFLDQLQRVEDPDQVAPSEIPDLDVDAELEVARLEVQLLEAKKRLAQKRASMSKTPVEGGETSTANEGDAPLT